MSMTVFDITLDDWAKGKNSTTISTIIIQSICLFISLILLIIRIYQIYKQLDKFKLNIKFAALPITQFLMLFMSCIYMGFHDWNYIHLYFSSNPIDCTVWFIIIMTALGLTRVLLFAFLMLRSSLSFENTFCAIPLKLSIIFVTITTFGNMIPIIILLTDFIAIQPFFGFCWRIIGEMGWIAGNIFHGLNCIASIAALIIFYWKSRSVKKLFIELQSDGKMNDGLIELNFEFKKHINLGMLTIVGTVFIYFVANMFSVLLGISFALDQTVNNILTFIIFKENGYIYKCICCKHGQLQHETNVINLTDIRIPTNTHSVNADNSHQSSAPSSEPTDLKTTQSNSDQSNKNYTNRVVIH